MEKGRELNIRWSNLSRMVIGRSLDATVWASRRTRVKEITRGRETFKMIVRFEKLKAKKKGGGVGKNKRVDLALKR